MNKSQKKEAAGLFVEEQRLEELRHIPKSQRSVEQEREFSRLYQKSRRRDQRRVLRGEESPYDKFETAQDFWDANRLLLPKKKLEELLAQQELVLDQEWWMQHGFEVDPNDESVFVGLQEGLQDLDAFISTHGLIHDETSACQHPDLRAFEPSRALLDAFYKDPERFNALCQESPATDIFCRFGIRVALSSYHVRTFKQRIAEHQRGELQPDVRRAHADFESDRCWLCNLWEEAQKRNLATPEGHQPQGALVPPTTTA